MMLQLRGLMTGKYMVQYQVPVSTEFRHNTGNRKFTEQLPYIHVCNDKLLEKCVAGLSSQ
jgi:hypothetical protein